MFVCIAVKLKVTKHIISIKYLVRMDRYRHIKWILILCLSSLNNNIVNWPGLKHVYQLKFKKGLSTSNIQSCISWYFKSCIIIIMFYNLCRYSSTYSRCHKNSSAPDQSTSVGFRQIGHVSSLVSHWLIHYKYYIMQLLIYRVKRYSSQLYNSKN